MSHLGPWLSVPGGLRAIPVGDLGKACSHFHLAESGESGKGWVSRPVSRAGGPGCKEERGL